MSRAKHVMMTAIISIIFFSNMHAVQMESIGPFGGSFECLAISRSNSHIMLAGTTAGGIYKSTNAGDSWIYMGYRGKQITSIAIDCTNPNLIYLTWRSSTGYTAACKSVNGGASWSEIITPARVVQTSSRLHNFVLIGNEDGLYKSTDAAENLHLINYAFGYNNLAEICSDPVDSSIFYLGTNNAVYKSSDLAETWTQLRYLEDDSPSSAYTNDIAVSSVNHNIVLVATSHNGLLISHDGGQNWIKYDRLGGQAHGAICDPNDANTIYVASLGGFYKSTDQGVTFNEIKDGYLHGADMVDGNFYLIESIDGTIYKSQDNGQTWRDAVRGISNIHINSISMINDQMVSSLEGGYYPRLMRYSESNWDTLLTDDVGDDIYTSQNDQYLYMLGSWRYFAKSETSFGNWVRFEEGVPYCIPNDLAINGDTLYFSSHPAFEGLYAGIYKSIDNGCHWALSSDGLPTVTRQHLSTVRTGPISVGCICIDPNANNRLLAGAYNAIYESANFAGSWEELITIDSMSVTDILIDPANSNVIYFIAGNPYGGKPYSLYISKDGGTTFNRIDCGLSSVSSLYYSREVNALFCGGKDGLVMTQDEGSTWEDIGNNWEGMTVSCINMDANKNCLYVGTESNGIYEIDLTTLSIKNQDIPNLYILPQNYPNPFNPITTIFFAVYESSDVRLQIFDITGRLVETLVDGFKEAGEWNVKWDAGRYSSGIYIYRLECGGRHFSRKMILMK